MERSKARYIRVLPPLSGAGTSYRGNTITNRNAETGTRISVSEGTDNTARKQAEEALLKAGALQSAIFNRATSTVEKKRRAKGESLDIILE